MVAGEAAEEAEFLQQAATKWTRTACWAAQDSAHAAMLKQQAESLSAVSLAEDNVSNVALLHLELKVARKKLVTPCTSDSSERSNNNAFEVGSIL